MVESEKIINSEDITKIFGLRSNIFKKSYGFLQKQAETHKKDYENKYREWTEAFKDIYGVTDEDLFLRHTYFALILKAFVIIKLSIIQNLDLDDAYADYKDSDISAFYIFEFEHFYWTDLNKKIFQSIYNRLEGFSYAREDLFQELYQQIFLPLTRHKIGEFYTPVNLVKIMIDEIYEFGSRLLDPSCGSGSFLIQIILRILNSEKPNSLKYLAINNVYGFDINPLAILTTKINILLLYFDYFDFGKDPIPNINIFLMDSLFPEKYEKKIIINLKNLYSSFDLIIGNPPWLTYKDLNSKSYQKAIRELANELEIKPKSQYITHIELAAIFFYAMPYRFLNKEGQIFFVITRSILNGDHCFNFRAFKPFRKLEIWDFPEHYFFNVDHICLKAEYIGYDNDTFIAEKYPIKAKIFTENLELKEETLYNTIKIEENGAMLILPFQDVRILERLNYSEYRKLFFQGATLVPRTLVFFQLEKKEEDDVLIISSDPDIVSRSKRIWRFYFQNEKIEKAFRFKTFLNLDLIPFKLKNIRSVFLPINDDFEFDKEYLDSYPYASEFYRKVNKIYKERKKNTSDIETLFDNLNYWNKLTKQRQTKRFLVVYNASGANLKAAVIEKGKKKIIVGSENYYYYTDSKEEAYYLSAILNSPIMTKNIKLIKSSRHIHKRPFSFPISKFDPSNKLHQKLARKGIKAEAIVQDFIINNPGINSEKVRILMVHKLKKIDNLISNTVFK
ncbi:MAG: N-6 DNA methylase [Promethearchaeota archaeon]